MGPGDWAPGFAQVAGSHAQEADLEPLEGYQAEALICSYSWPCKDAIAVMLCESGGVRNAFSEGNYGLFQINGIHRARVSNEVDRLFDPATNVEVAYSIWREQGWKPWACQP